MALAGIDSNDNNSEKAELGTRSGAQYIFPNHDSD
jgi:hypothetical protein